MKPKNPKAQSEEGGRKPAGDAESPDSKAQPDQGPVAGERRGRHRVADDQKSGQGSLSALSKMQMIERTRAMVNPRHKEPGEDTPG